MKNFNQSRGLIKCSTPPFNTIQDSACYLITDLENLLKYEDFLCGKCISQQQIGYSSSSLEKFKLDASGYISDYSDGGFYLFINPNLVLRSNVNLLFELIQDSLILDRSNKMFLISINAIHNYFKAVVKFNILTEFSISGLINVSVEIEVCCVVKIGC